MPTEPSARLEVFADPIGWHLLVSGVPDRLIARAVVAGARLTFHAVRVEEDAHGVQRATRAADDDDLEELWAFSAADGPASTAELEAFPGRWVVWAVPGDA